MTLIDSDGATIKHFKNWLLNSLYPIAKQTRCSKVIGGNAF